MMYRFFLLAAAVFATGCATKTAGDGTHLVYRAANGTPFMQFDYPNADFCQRTEAVASGNVRCQKDSAGSQLRAQATLRYEPPGMDVVGHYADLAACSQANSRMAMGVKLAKPCAAK